MSIYQEPLRSCIHALKYEGNTRLAQPLGQMLAYTFRHYNLVADVIIPVPLHVGRQKARGYNHADLLARNLAHHIGIAVRNDILIRHRATPAQVGFDRQRAQSKCRRRLCLLATICNWHACWTYNRYY